MSKKILSTALSLILAVAMVIMVNVPVTAAETETDTATLSVEAFSIGNGFVVEPTTVQILEGDTVAAIFDRVLNAQGITYNAYGSVDNGFYLSKINIPNYDNIPQCIKNNIGDYLDEGSGTTLGENEYSALAGWLYTVNNISANVGMSDYKVKSGDVIRVQFSLYWGADVGLANQMGMEEYGVSDFYPVGNKDNALRVYAETKETATSDFVNTLTTVNAVDSEILASLYGYLPTAYSNFTLGDVDENGVINLKDVALMQQYTSDSVKFSFIQGLKADVTKDGSVNLKDGTTIQQIITQG